MKSAKPKIRDGVFRLLLNDEEKVVELYQTLKKTRNKPKRVELFTIETVISGKFKNDLAFVVDDEAMVIAEHMSSSYRNLPLRFWIYGGLLYEKYVKVNEHDKFLYGSKLYKIPTPKFVVFYNGKEKKPEKEILTLSQAFKDNASDDKFGFVNMEVPVYNIRPLAKLPKLS